MPSVVPSQIVQFIDNTLSHFLGPTCRVVDLHPSTCGALNAVLRLVDELPNVLLPSEPRSYARFIQSVESIRFAVAMAKNQDARHNAVAGPPSLRPDGEGEPNQVEIIRDALAGCPDEIPQHNSQEIRFIKDADFRETLLRDLAAIQAALSHGEWKAATVLAGSLLEAMLLWAVQQRSSTDLHVASSAVLAAGKLQKAPPNDLLNWSLHDFVEVAEELRLIESDTAKEIRLAKGFRNLIHPGRAIRLKQVCDRGTALVAVAAVDHVSRDLVIRFP